MHRPAHHDLLLSVDGFVACLIAGDDFDRGKQQE